MTFFHVFKEHVNTDDEHEDKVMMDKIGVLDSDFKKQWATLAMASEGQKPSARAAKTPAPKILSCVAETAKAAPNRQDPCGMRRAVTTACRSSVIGSERQKSAVLHRLFGSPFR